MTTLPVGRLAALLRETARGVYATEAATELLIAHDRWLRRGDFIAACVDLYDADGEPIRYNPHSIGTVDGRPTLVLTPRDPQATVAAAQVLWDQLPGFVETAPCSGSEDRILRLAAELAGHDTGAPLAELLTGLDETNSALVVVAIAQALHRPRPGGPGEAMTVSDDDLALLAEAIADPGRYTAQVTLRRDLDEGTDDYSEPLSFWSARAVLAALAERGVDQ